MKGLEPSTFCMARTKREMTGVDWNDRLRLLHRSRESEPTRDVSNRQPHLAENLARMKPMPLNHFARDGASPFSAARSLDEFHVAQRAEKSAEGLRRSFRHPPACAAHAAGLTGRSRKTPSGGSSRVSMADEPVRATFGGRRGNLSVDPRKTCPPGLCRCAGRPSSAAPDLTCSVIHCTRVSE
jgi:hypothetical protein